MSSLFNAMTAAVSGLNAQATAISNISSNVSNAQTVGYKRVDTSFSDLVDDATSTSSLIGGALATPNYRVSTQGSLVTASSSTDLGLSGNGFFVVRSAHDDASGNLTFDTANSYTRRGDFSLNNAGYLVNGSGYYLEGYSVDPSTKVADTSRTVPVQISQQIDSPVPTSSVSVNANLPSNAEVSSSATAAPLSPTTVQIYDALGNTHSVKLSWSKNGADQWSTQVSVPDAVGGFSNSLDIGFGNSATGTPGTLQAVAPSAGSTGLTVSTNAAGAAATVGFSVDFGSGPQAISLNLGIFGQAAGVTQYASAGQQVEVTSTAQNGVARGSFKDLSIDDNGRVTLNYDNGQSKVFYQTPVAQFNNPNGLKTGDGGIYSETLASGNAQLGTAGANGAATIAASTLESSNVDIAEEFTKMIQAQRVYSANSRTITTANDMLSEVINIVKN